MAKVQSGLFKHVYCVGRREDKVWDTQITSPQFWQAVEKLPEEMAFFSGDLCAGHLFLGGIVSYSKRSESIATFHETEEGLRKIVSELDLPQPESRILHDPRYRERYV